MNIQREPFVSPNPQYPTPRDDVDLAIYDLRKAIEMLQTLRHKNDTADFVLARSFEIKTLRVWLEHLAEDILKSVHKDAAE